MPQIQPQLKYPGKWEGQAGSQAARGTETWNSEKNKGPVGSQAARWEEEREEEGGEKGGGEERAAQQELCPILRVAGLPSTVASLNMIMLDIQIVCQFLT